MIIDGTVRAELHWGTRLSQFIQDFFVYKIPTIHLYYERANVGIRG